MLSLELEKQYAKQLEARRGGDRGDQYTGGKVVDSATMLEGKARDQAAKARDQAAKVYGISRDFRF